VNENGPPGQERRPDVETTEAANEVLWRDDTDITAATVVTTADGPRQARRRADRIRLLVVAMANQRDKVLDLITEASELHDWRTLGYSTWKDYVNTEFGEALHRLCREDRRETVLLLSRTGLSTRAIAPIVGVGKSTIDRDLSGVPDGTPDDDQLDEAIAAIKKITSTNVLGIDGKSYTRPAPAPPRARRRALTDQFLDAAYDFTRTVERLDRLASDDRFPQNADKIAARHRNDLLRHRDLLQEVIGRLPEVIR
jgi:hypothetical protein